MRKQSLFCAVLAVAMAVPFFSSCNKAADIINNLIELTSQITVVEPDMPGLTYPETYQVTLINESTGESKTATTELKNGKKVASVKIMGTATGLFSVSVRGVVFDEANNKLKDFWANAAHVVVVAGIVACDPTVSCTVYNTVKLKDNHFWMAENLRYLPVGITPSADLNNVTAGVFYPLGVADDGTTRQFLTSQEAIASQGYVYQVEVALGCKIGGLTSVEQAQALEGTQGVCPLGWHLPTLSEIKGLVGKVAQETTETTAPYFNGSDGSVKLLNEDGFNMSACGQITIQDVTSTSGLISYVIYEGRVASGFFCGSTYKTVSYLVDGDASSGIKALTFQGLMTMTNKATEAAYTCNGSGLKHRMGAPVRCIKDSASE
ncbi:MAG: hypothetical protein J6Y32_06245 [Bacteroidales bacterium]|nr:hypothetical protein [Bacteroidales bacterium]